MTRSIMFWIIAACAAVGISSPAGAVTIFVSPCGQDAWVGTAPACSAPFGPKQTIQ